MPKITFIEHNGTEHNVDVAEGMSVMEMALEHNVPGIDADCGGECACATCHVFVDEEWLPKTGTPSEAEAMLLAFVEGASANSRLACQIKINESLDGLMVRLPEFQH